MGIFSENIFKIFFQVIYNKAVRKKKSTFNIHHSAASLSLSLHSQQVWYTEVQHVIENVLHEPPLQSSGFPWYVQCGLSHYVHALYLMALFIF